MSHDLQTAYRNAWLLWLAAVVFIVGFLGFVLLLAYNAPGHGWEMGAKNFVPAQSDYGEGYYLPVTPPAKGGVQ